jgi:hypothetical protein
LLAFTLLYSPAIYSYLNIINEYGRGTPIDQYSKEATSTGFSLSSYMSFFYPFATTKNADFLTDDLSMRNCYFSIGGLLLAFTQVKNKSYMIKALVIGAIFMLLLSLGGPIKSFFYSVLPGLKFIRTNGEFRVFAILSFCTIAGLAFKQLENEKNIVTSKFFRKTCIIFLLISVTTLLATCPAALSHLKEFFTTGIGSNGIKGILDYISFKDVLFISALIQSTVLFLLWKMKSKGKTFALVIVADLIINSILYLPFSGVGKVTLAEIQSTYDKAPKGIIKPPLTKLNDIDTLSTIRAGLVGSWSFYNKQIGSTSLTDYPSFFTNTYSYFSSELPPTINQLPFVFFEGSKPHTKRQFLCRIESDC